MIRIPCTKDNPSNRDPWKWYHPDAKLLGIHYDHSDLHNDYEEYECPHCGLRFEVTIAN